MGEHEGEDVLVWSTRPWSHQRRKGVSALAIMAGAMYGSFVWGGPILGLLALVVLAGGAGPFFVTTRYRLTPEEVSVDSPFLRTRRPWSRFRRAYVGEQGVSLSPFKGKHLLEPYRSVMLRYGERREEVLRWVRRYGPEPTIEKNVAERTDGNAEG